MHKRCVIRSKIITGRSVIKIMFLMQSLPHRRSRCTISLLSAPIRLLEYQDVL